MYVVHQLVHTDDRPHGCNMCTKQFKSIKNLNQHVKLVHTNRTKEFCCTQCNRAFFTKYKLNRHQNIHKNNGEGFQDCYFCHKKFSRSDSLVEHLRTHTHEKPFFCPEQSCSYSSAQISHLKGHQRRWHSSTSNRVTNAKIWTCYFCLKTCTNITIHMRRHTKEVPFKCGFCKQKYVRLDLLKRHIAIHTNEKPFRCSQCNKECKTKGELKGHMVSHTKEKRYFCNFCNYGSYFKWDFNKHVLKRHNNASN